MQEMSDGGSGTHDEARSVASDHDGVPDGYNSYSSRDSRRT